jgi:peptidoglycan/xylan/chitin deacetylase (PgdA/CDA1 family)
MGRRRTAVLSLVLLALLVTAAVSARGHGGAQAGSRAGLEVAGDPLLERSDPAEVALLRRRARRAGRAVDRALRRRSVVRRGSRRRREIALSFDDGPSRYTRAILRILRRAGVQATFFPVGYSLDRWPRSLAAEARVGHVIGDHTLHHPPLASLSFRAQLREIRGEARRLRRHRMPRTRLVRPPYGSYDRRTVTIARRLGMLVVMWSVDSQDYTRPGRRAIVRNVLAGARPGAIVLMHDGGGPREQTVAALPAVIRRLRRRGFRLVTVPELLRTSRTAR